MFLIGRLTVSFPNGQLWEVSASLESASAIFAAFDVMGAACVNLTTSPALSTVVLTGARLTHVKQIEVVLTFRAPLNYCPLDVPEEIGSWYADDTVDMLTGADFRMFAVTYVRYNG